MEAVAVMSSTVQDRVKKEKKRYMWWCKCSVLTMLAFVVLFALGIVLLVFFAKEWSTTSNKRYAGYVGLALLLVGAIGIIIGIIAVIIVYRAIKRVDNPNRFKHFQHQRGADGTFYPGVEYPRQKFSAEPVDTMPSPSAPAEIKVEVSQDTKM